MGRAVASSHSVATVPRWSSQPGLGGSALTLLLVWALVIACGRMVMTAQAAQPGQAGIAVGALVVVLLGSAALVVSARRTLFQVMTSLPFAVSLLTALMLCTITGTLVLQNAQPDVYVERYGADGARLLLALGLDDIFHTLWFSELLGILALSLVLVAARNQAWRLPRLGHLAAHVGVVVILAGGLIGNLGGLKGRVDLRVGEQAERLVRTGKLPQGAEVSVPLGFALRLDDFAVDRYADLYRLRTYEPRGDHWRATGSWSPSELRDWTELPSGGRFRVTRIDQDSAPAGPAESAAHAAYAAHVGLEEHAWHEGHEAHAARHLLAVGEDDAAPWIEVRPGESFGLPDGRVVDVREFLPDFSYDIATRRAASASARPDNPALQVVLRSDAGEREAARWVFAKFPDLSMDHAPVAGPALRYRYEAGLPASSVAGDLAAPVDAGEDPHAGHAHGARPDGLALTLELDTGSGPPGSVLLVADEAQPLRLPGGGVLVFEKRGDDVKAYTSRVSVLEDGQAVATAIIRVNEPFAWQGFLFYQSNYDEGDLRYSGLTVVKDPGLPIVFSGFVLMCLGVLYVYMVRPRLLARKAVG
jgi:hypothetical protein